MDTHHGETVSGLEKGDKLCEASSEIGARVGHDLIIASICDEELEERSSHAPCRVVLRGKEENKRGEVIHHHVDAHMPQLVWRRHKEGVDADNTAVMGWLEVVDDRAKNTSRGHPAAVLLADRALLHVVPDEVVVDAMAWEQLVEIVSRHPDAAVSAIEDVGCGEALLGRRHNSSVLGGTKEQSVPLQGRKGRKSKTESLLLFLVVPDKLVVLLVFLVVI